MKPPYILVDKVQSIARDSSGTTRGELTVKFSSGVDARLDPRQSRDLTWSEVLESRRETGQPVYVEIDPETHRISAVLLSRELTVTAIREGDVDTVELELEISHARHYLRRDHPRFPELLKTLEEARRKKKPMLITESLDGTSIVDVRLCPPRRKDRG